VQQTNGCERNNGSFSKFPSQLRSWCKKVHANAGRETRRFGGMAALMTNILQVNICVEAKVFLDQRCRRSLAHCCRRCSRRSVLTSAHPWQRRSPRAFHLSSVSGDKSGYPLHGLPIAPSIALRPRVAAHSLMSGASPRVSLVASFGAGVPGVKLRELALDSSASSHPPVVASEEGGRCTSSRWFRSPPVGRGSRRSKRRILASPARSSPPSVVAAPARRTRSPMSVGRWRALHLPDAD
jgi:hypothetical protein